MTTAKKITENPKTTDVILFELETPDSSNCFTADPYKVDNVTIYFIERDFLGTNFGEYDSSAQDENLVVAVQVAQEAFCGDPTVANKKLLDQAQANLAATTQVSKFFYKERTPVEIVGTYEFPAWLSTDTTNAYLDLVPEDADGNPQFGHFTYEWHPMGKVREGDYFICWTWTPLPAGSSLSAHLPFKIDGDPRAVTSIPTHVTATDKYEILLERYLPEMYKNVICEGDLTPDSTDKLNQAVAKGFTFLEDLTNQIIDLFDSNALHESMLAYLSNLFDVRLRSSDPTLWRRQIKEAIPVFKKKGTLEGLEDAYAMCGMELNKYTQFWQLTSPYTWEESFDVDSTADTVFQLEKDDIVLPIDDANFALYLREEGSSTYTVLNKDYVSFSVEDCIVKMTWIGEQLSSPLTIIKGDVLRVKYEYKEVPDTSEQTLQDYILSLPLQDQRDEGSQKYPPKNWNVRLIEEEDPLFDVLIPVRHPFADPIVFGFIRTEFPYSENIYNMEEYNGSTRPSFDACQINRDFLDPCGACISSSYMVDVGIEELNNDRLIEAQDILDEYMPFHAQLHSINFSGEVNEFVQSPTEDIEVLVNIDFTQYILSGQSNPFFNRIMDRGLPGQSFVIDREDLATKTTVLSGKLGTGYNDHVAFISPDIELDGLGIAVFNHILEVLAPSPNAGTYTLGETNNRLDGNPHVARLSGGAIEPLNESPFTFNLWNILFKQSIADIIQDDLIEFSDSSVDFSSLGVKSQWDSTHTPDYTGGAWKVLIPGFDSTAYEIEDVQDGVLVLESRSTFPTTDTTGITYILLNDLDATIDSGTTGDLDVTRRGFVNLKAPDLAVDRDKFILAGDFLHYDNDGLDYEILKFQDPDKLWIAEWTNGDVVGTSIDTRRKLVDKATGLFGYKGLHLTTFSDHEQEFNIINGTNPVAPLTDEDRFKESFMFKIGNDFYRIEEWDGINVVLAGKEQTWTTLIAGGTAVAYSLVQFTKDSMNVGFTVFDHLDRDGKDVIIREVFDQIDQNTAIVALSTNPGSGMEENVSAEESISFVIETLDGETQEGEI